MNESIKYEDGIKKIEEIIQKLEDGDIELEESINLYKEAFDNIKNCKELLDKTEGKIKIVQEEASGNINFKDFN